MKKGLLFSIIGIILIAISMYLSLNKPAVKTSLEDVLNSNAKYFKNDSSFGYLYFEKYRDQYLLTVRSRMYTDFDSFPTPKDSDFKVAVDIKDNVLTSNVGIKLTYKNDYFILEGTDNYSIFSGTYKLESEDSYYQILQDTDDISGFYKTPGINTTNEEEMYNFNITKLNDDTYAIVGVIRRLPDYYAFTGERIEMKDGIGEATLKDGIHYFSLNEDKLIIQGTDNCVLEGEYNKSNKIKYSDLVREMEVVHIYEKGVEGIALSN